MKKHIKIAVLGEGVTAQALINNQIRLGYDVVSIKEAELIVASPGIPNEKLPQTDLPIISEVEFAYLLIQQQESIPKIIGITGTNGKSTVTALIAHCLEVPPLGNFGDPLINYVGTKHPYLVVELSSYQLERTIEFKPDIAIILNITPDHLERHKTVEEYSFQKSKIVKNHHFYLKR